MAKKHPSSLLSRYLFKKRYLGLALLGLVLVFLFQAAQPPDWWQFSPTEQISSQPVFYQHTIILATNHGTIRSLDRRSGKVRWQYQRDKEVTSQPFVTKDFLFAGYKDGVIVALNPRTGELVWQHTVPNNSAFQTGIYYTDRNLLYGDTEGTVRAISIWSGKEVWTHHTPPPESVDQLLTKNGIIWFGSLLLDKQTLYIVRTHGYLAALDTNSGKLKWEKTVAGTIVADPLLTRTNIMVSTDQTPLTSLERQTGQSKEPAEVATQAEIFCQYISTHRGPLTEATEKAQLGIPFHLFLQESELGQRVIQVDKSGKVVSYKKSDLSQEWAVELNYEPRKCFFDYDRSLYISSADGKLSKVNLRTNTIDWQRQFPSKLILMDSIKKSRSADGSDNVRYYADYLFVSDERENFYRINPANGQITWQFKTAGTVYIPPIIQGNQLFVVSTNGGLYRLNSHTGRPDQFALVQPKISWKANTDSVSSEQIYELALTSKSDRLVNPFTSVDITAEFTNEQGQKITVNGFYYDHDQWRVRFNPPTTGTWQWRLTWVDPFRTHQLHGQFTSQRDHAFLKTSADSPKWLTKDGKTISSLVGLNDCFVDNNADGSPLNDFFTEEGTLKVATIGGEIPQTLSFNTKHTSLAEYLDTYQDSFNIFRQGIGSCAPPLYFAEDFMYSKYLTKEGKDHDQVSQELYKRGYSIWFTMFGFSLPFGENITYPDEKFALENYLEYIVARFGAYVDVWEISNEAVASDAYVQTLAKYIDHYDPYDRLISVSWEKPQLAEITVTSPHWYQTERDAESDLATIAQINKFPDHQKPIIFGEQGNELANWDPTSARRMRVRIWTAFFHQSSLIFWNQSHAKNYYNPVFRNGNLYIGNEERQYAQAFLRLTSELPLGLTPVSPPTFTTPLRWYTLKSESVILTYFFNSELNPGAISSALNTFTKPATVEWFSTETGKLLKTETIEPGAVSVSPAFQSDILVKISAQ